MTASTNHPASSDGTFKPPPAPFIPAAGASTWDYFSMTRGCSCPHCRTAFRRVTLGDSTKRYAIQCPFCHRYFVGA